jgi:hypothetical protein
MRVMGYLPIFHPAALPCYTHSALPGSGFCCPWIGQPCQQGLQKPTLRSMRTPVRTCGCNLHVVHVCLAESLPPPPAAGLVRNYLYQNANVTVEVYGVNVSTIVDVSAFSSFLQRTLAPKQLVQCVLEESTAAWEQGAAPWRGPAAGPPARHLWQALPRVVAGPSPEGGGYRLDVLSPPAEYCKAAGRGVRPAGGPARRLWRHRQRHLQAGEEDL